MTSSASQPSKEGKLWEDLIVSILAVNNYSLERTYPLLLGLRKQMITDPRRLAAWDLDEIVNKPKESGYDRGRFMTKLFATRLAALGAFIQEKGLDECQKVLSSSNHQAIGTFLLTVKGIGPVVLENFFLLRGIKPTK